MTKRPRHPGQRRARAGNLLVWGLGAVVIGLAAVLALAPLLSTGPTPPASAEAQSVVISMAGFTPNRITISAGRPVTLAIKNPDSQFHTDGGGWHQFAIDEAKLDVRIAPHSTETVTLPALHAGTYQFYCDICCGGRASPSMIGTLVVKG